MECKKKTFLTREEAVKRVAEIHQAEDIGHRKPIRSYRCEKCGHFHLTSWSNGKKKEVEVKKAVAKINRKESEEEFWREKYGW
jgi:hypothetical protein